MRRVSLLVPLAVLVIASLVQTASAQRTHGRVVGIRGNDVQVRLSPTVDVRPGVRGTIYGNVRGQQGIIARIESARKVGGTWTCTITRSALRVQPGHTVAFNTTVAVEAAMPTRPPEPGTIIIDADTPAALVTSGGVRMGTTEYSQRFSPRNATFYVQKQGYQTERVVVDIVEGEVTRRDLSLRRLPPPPKPEPPPAEPEPAEPEPAEPEPAEPEPAEPPPAEPEPEPPVAQQPPSEDPTRPIAAPTTVPSLDPGYPPSPETDATLSIFLNEPDADLVINGLLIRRIAGATQTQVNVIPGTYDVTVYKGGFYTRAQRITVGPNAEESMRFDLIGASAQISVNSDPVGARVKLAGVEVGTTPLIIPYAPGRFEITVESEGYQPTSEFVVAEPDSVAQMIVGLEPALGWVFVGARPSSEIRVDDVYVGRGGQALRLMAGRYTVEVREGGETLLRREIEVLAGSEESLAAGASPPQRP